jgi:hypothetical protein
MLKLAKDLPQTHSLAADVSKLTQRLLLKDMIDGWLQAQRLNDAAEAAEFALDTLAPPPGERAEFLAHLARARPVHAPTLLYVGQALSGLKRQPELAGTALLRAGAIFEYEEDDRRLALALDVFKGRPTKEAVEGLLQWDELGRPPLTESLLSRIQECVGPLDFGTTKP